jgi:NAD dependent epimerase/dehydratase family enzyme
VGRKADDRKGAVLNADYIIHLAGANIAEKPWTNKRKEQIITSREHPTYLLRSKEK